MPSLYKLIVYSGVLAFLSMAMGIIAVFTGMDFRFHKYGGMSAFAFACVHVGLIIYKNMKIRASKKAAKKVINN